MRFRNLLIPAFCFLHVIAITWWSLPQSFHAFVAERAGPHVLEAKLFEALALTNAPRLKAFLTGYIDLTGSQQYWDFFAPHTSSLHQYVSVCGGIKVNKDSGDKVCAEQTYFTNLSAGFAEFKVFGSDRSRIYRLTENLIKRGDNALRSRFARYYAEKAETKVNQAQLYLLAHQFELHSELPDLPRAGYRSDQVLLNLP